MEKRNRIRLKPEIAAILGRLTLEDLELEILRGFVSDLAKTYASGALRLTTADRQTLRALARCLRVAAGFDQDLCNAQSAADRMRIAEALQKADNSAKRHMESLTALIAGRKAPPAKARKERAKSLLDFDPEGLV